MNPIIIIPARWGSSRFPGKPLAEMAGRSLIEHTWRAARRTKLPVYVASDDARIARAVIGFDGACVMTGEARNGTERCAEAAWQLGHTGPVVNWQGDSPLADPAWIAPLLECLNDPNVAVATPVQPCDAATVETIRRDCLSGRPGATLAALDGSFRALTFSKLPIPLRGPWWLHIGIYAYSAEALAGYGREEGILERSEQLEQLRFLERGETIRCVPVDGPPIWEVNNPDDVYVVERAMEQRRAAV